ncbi:hypothetical protein QJS10_CPB20g00415 [Acorus calamus]|uniref:Uncharacterized protein n=1 Tax=Acorus calamus TaxID=4465 RepID=A0AAV9C8D1_ACOCL|nr:hypothetical protein QJS10_CPB20g00415 [Acorus calamus]
MQFSLLDLSGLSKGHAVLIDCSQSNIAQEHINGDEAPKVITDDIIEKIKKIKIMLDSMGEGEISVSAYDSSVSMIEDINGNGGPKFPRSLKWIVDHQLPHGSWEWIAKWLVREQQEGLESRESGVELLIGTIEICAGRSVL